MTREDLKSGVVFLEDNKDLQILLTRLLKVKLNLDCLCFSHFHDLKIHAKDVLLRKVTILDINLGPNEPSGLDAYQWLKENAYQGRILFLSGHASSNPLVLAARTNGVEVLEKPLRSNHLLALVQSASSAMAAQ